MVGRERAPPAAGNGRSDPHRLERMNERAEQCEARKKGAVVWLWIDDRDDHEKAGSAGRQPHVAGTEITVTAVLDLLAEGVFPQEIPTEKHFPQIISSRSTHVSHSPARHANTEWD